MKQSSMYRYFALIWKTSDSHQAATARLMVTRLRSAAPEWNVALDTDGLLVLHTATQSSVNSACTLNDRAGLVLGTMFSKHLDRHATAARGALSAEVSSAMARTNGQHLVSNYWGRYVAMIRGTNSGRVYVLRDPSGGLPCYLTTHRGIHAVFSHVEDCAQLAFFPLSINWGTIRAVTAGLLLQTGETTLTEVVEIRAGECIEVHGERIERSLYWNPVKVADSDVIEEPRVAVDALRRTIRSCTDAWAACYPRILHSLSGGLDSSIVLSCLTRATSTPAVTAINHYTSATEGDERRYARLAARHCGCELVEHWADATSVKLDSAFEVSRTMAPAHYVFELLHGEFEAEMSETKAATAFFQGGGGDGVLLQNGAEHAPVDYVYRHGLRPQLLQVAHDAARVTQLSMWSLVRRGIARGLRKPSWKLQLDALAGTSFVHPEVHQSLLSHIDALIPAWLQDAPSIPDGKRWHLFVSSFPAGFSRPYNRFERPEIVFPLLSQPIHELCLRIPTYLIFYGGWDRAMARRAFSNDIPAQIVRRRGKGGADCVTKEILEANASVVTDTLLNGELVRQGIVQREKLEAYLLNPRPDVDTDSNEAISLFETEVFLHSWRGFRQRAAA